MSREDEPAEPATCGALEWCFHNSFVCDDASQVPQDPVALLEAARDALDERTVHSLVAPPELLRERQLRDGEQVLTYRFLFRSAQIALSRDRVQCINAAACRRVAQMARLRWTLGYPVQQRNGQ